jgi:PPOX class probable F420-dependent enzyme
MGSIEERNMELMQTLDDAWNAQDWDTFDKRHPHNGPAVSVRPREPCPRPGSSASMPRQMSRQEVESFLSHGTRTAKVATVMQDGRPHVMPVWFVLDREQIVFTTGANSVKGRDLRRDPRIALVVSDDTPPFAFVHVRGRVAIQEDAAELLRIAIAIAARYMGEARAEEFGRRNAVPGEILVRVTPERVIAEQDVAG